MTTYLIAAGLVVLAILTVVTGAYLIDVGHENANDYQPRHTGVWPMPERTIADDLHDQADAIDNAIDDGWDPDATSWNMVAVPDDRKRAWQNKIRTAPAPVARQMAEAGWKA
jgi:hypothetical protein